MGSFESPPKWALNVLQRICPSELMEEVEGDLYEAYNWRIEERGSNYARRKYIWEVLRYLRYFNINIQTQNTNIMLFKNYFKTGLRFLWKTRGYSSLNILGLSIGIALCWIAYLFVTDEYSFDRYHDKSDRIYRTTASMVFDGQKEVFAGASYVIGEEVPNRIPEIESASRVKSGFGLLNIGTEYFSQRFHYVDADFFKIFDVDFIAGAPGTFVQPDVTIISESVAERLGIGTDLVNKELIMQFGQNEVRFSIIGVYKDFPLNSSVRPPFMIPFSYWAQNNPNRLSEWFDINMNAFFLLNQDANLEEVNRKMTDILVENFDGESEVTLGLQSISDIHLNPDFDNSNGIDAQGDNQLILIVVLIGILCLVIACFNYSNFAVGNYIVRLREVAVRKVFGAQKRAVFQQFVTESFLSALISMFLAVGIIALILPGFAEYANKSYTVEMIFSQNILLGGLGILLVVTFLAGIYPALLLSSYSTLNGLKGKAKLTGRGLLSKGLVTLQFAISVFLIAGMLTIDKQLNYFINFDLGYSGENLVRLGRAMFDNDQILRYKRDLAAVPGIKSVSVASGFNGTRMELDNGGWMDVRHARVDLDYIKTMEIKILEGRDFDPDLVTDYDNALIVNQAFVDALGLDNPVGFQTKFRYRDFANPSIIGVVQNFYYDSPKGDVEPLVMYISPQLVVYDHFLKFDPNSTDLLKNLEEVYASHFAPVPFNHAFVEDDILRQYQIESNIRKISRAGALVAIGLSCLGLMGFVGTQIRQRMKEVSIRKVVGAEPPQLFLLLSKRYFSLIIIGFITGLAVAIWLVQQWLANYSNRIDFGWDIALIAIGIVAAVSMLTIVSQLYRAMFLNPAKFLKEE